MADRRRRGRTDPGGHTAFSAAHSGWAEGKTVANAILLFTADDCGTVYLNGRQVGEIPRRTDAWKNGQAVDVTDRLTAGENLLAASVTNTGVGTPDLSRHLLLTYSDGSQESVLTNAQGWRVSRDRIADFASPDCDDSGAGWGAPGTVCPLRKRRLGKPCYLFGRCGASGWQCRAHAAA